MHAHASKTNRDSVGNLLEIHTGYMVKRGSTTGSGQRYDIDEEAAISGDDD